MIDRQRDGIFMSAECWKCKKCRKVFYPGTQFLVYTGGERAWVGCLACAGIFKDIVEGLQSAG